MTRRIVLLGIVATVLLTVAFFFLLYRPKSQEQAALLAEAAALQSQQQRLRNEISRLEDVRAREPQLLAELARMLELMPEGTEQPSVLDALQEIADAASLEITSLTFGEPELVPDAPAVSGGGKALAQIPVTMVVDGGYFETVDFFRRLELDVARAAHVDTVAIAESEHHYPLLATTWTGKLFGILPVTAPSSTPSPAAPAAGQATDTAAPPATSGSEIG